MFAGKEEPPSCALGSRGTKTSYSPKYSALGFASTAANPISFISAIHRIADNHDIDGEKHNRETLEKNDPASIFSAIHSDPLILSFKTPEDLNLTTLLESSIKSSPVAGFLPLRPFLVWTENFPNPEMRTSSPLARFSFRISKTFSTIRFDWALLMPVLLLRL
jgi:hypothetical protein